MTLTVKGSPASDSLPKELKECVTWCQVTQAVPVLASCMT